MKRLSQEDMNKLSEDGKRVITELYRELDVAERKKMEAREAEAKASAELAKLLKAKRKELGLDTKTDPDAPTLSEWQCTSREWWRIPVCLLTMPEFSLSDVVLCAYLIDVTKRGQREVLLSRPHASERTGISIAQVSRGLKKLESRNLIETIQTGREVKVKLTGAMHLMSDRDYRSEPAEGGVI